MATSRRRDRGRSEVEPLDARAARVAALDSLARRDRPAAELCRKLVDKGYDRDVVAGVVDRLCAEKLVDDRRYVENFVGFHAARGQGPVRIRSELRTMGIQGEVVETAVAAYPDWIGQLCHAYQKKFGAAPATDYADRRRRARFLAYRGFTGAQIRLGLGFDTDLDADT